MACKDVRKGDALRESLLVNAVGPLEWYQTMSVLDIREK